MKVSVRADGLRQVEAMLDNAADQVVDKAKRTTGRACNNIKKDVQQRWRGLKHLPHLPRAITYDVTAAGTVVHGEVGADHGRLQGKLAWVPEYGSPTSAPNPALSPAADKETPVWERYIGDLGVDLLGGP